jgi:RNA polymerase sigma-70 factor, ECF subfamily
MDDQQQGEIAQGLREGRAEAWHALYDAYSRPVWQAVARLMGPGSADVADVVQETFLAAARSAGGYDPSRGSLGLWLGGIARNHVAVHYRRQERQDRIRHAAGQLGEGGRWLDNPEPGPPETLQRAELAVLVRAALNELPADYAGLLEAKYLDAASVEQIAAQSRLSLDAVRSKLARARRAFRQAFTKWGTKNQKVPE